MTREKASKVLEMFLFKQCDLERTKFAYDANTVWDAVKIASEALEREHVLDKIKAEIFEEKECAYADFERYKVEYLGQDWEDVYDSLPQDDYRYGMERCLEIIDKYKAESEVENGDK